MISKNCNNIFAFKIISICALLASAICLIVDLAVNKNITWSIIAIASIFGGLAILGSLLLVAKNRIITILLTISIIVIPLLYIIQIFTFPKDWFYNLGLQISLASIVATWISFALIKLFKINKMIMSSIIIFLYGVGLSSCIDYFVSKYSSTPFLTLENLISISICLLISIFLFIKGISKNREKQAKVL